VPVPPDESQSLPLIELSKVAAPVDAFNIILSVPNNNSEVDALNATSASVEDAVIVPLVRFVNTTLSVPDVALRVEPVLVRFAPLPEKLVQESVSVVGLYVSVDVVPLETILLPVAIPVVTNLCVASIDPRDAPVLVRFAPLP
tara:strand:- start:21 stop:449 length:429 start_codon:yes stop_codon:yes gene_type:complete